MPAASALRAETFIFLTASFLLSSVGALCNIAHRHTSPDQGKPQLRGSTTPYPSLWRWSVGRARSRLYTARCGVQVKRVAYTPQSNRNTRMLSY